MGLNFKAILSGTPLLSDYLRWLGRGQVNISIVIVGSNYSPIHLLQLGVQTDQGGAALYNAVATSYTRTCIMPYCCWYNHGLYWTGSLNVTHTYSITLTPPHPPPPPPPSSAAYTWIGSALVKIMACRLFGAKPLSNPMLGYCPLDP